MIYQSALKEILVCAILSVIVPMALLFIIYTCCQQKNTVTYNTQEYTADDHPWIKEHDLDEALTEA